MFVQINLSQVYLGEVEAVVKVGWPCELALPAAIPDKKKESRGNSPVTSLKELLHRAPLWREKTKRKRILNADWRNSISPTCQEDITINLSRVTSLQNRPCTCWKGKKKRKGKSHLMPIRFLLLAGKRCQSPSPGLGKLWGSHAFPWQRFCETSGTLVRIKQVLGSFRDFSWSDRRQGFSTWSGVWCKVFLLFWMILWPEQRRLV